MKNIFKKVLLSVILLYVLSPVLNVSGNDGVLGITPEGIYPVTQTDIAMEAEEIIIKMTGNSSATVSCRFDFKNFGEAQSVLMGFPARLDEEVTEFSPEDAITVRNFTARDEKGEIPVTLVDTIPNPPLKEVSHLAKYAKWYSFPVEFNKNETKTLYHTYEISFPYVSTGHVFAGYVLETGALWRGTIGHARVIFDLGECPVYSLQGVYPNNFFRLEGNQLIWERRNFKPAYNLWVTLNPYRFSPEWLEFLKSSGNTEEAEDLRNLIEFMELPPEVIRQNSAQYLTEYGNMIKERPIEALYIKSALGLPHGSEKPEILQCEITQQIGDTWHFDIYATDPDMDLAFCNAEINGIDNYTYYNDTWREELYYDRQKESFRARSYLCTNEDKPFSITFIMTDAAGNIDTETLILQSGANNLSSDLTVIPRQPPKEEASADRTETIAAVSQNHPETGESTSPGRVFHMEEETVSMLITGVIVVLLGCLAVIIILFLRSKKPGYLLFTGQILCLGAGLYFVVGVLSVKNVYGSELSENISAGIGLSAVFWAFSMLFMLAGVLVTANRKS